MITFLSLALGTLISEDLACIAAGLLVQRGEAQPASVIAACAVGIFAGDFGLWMIGRLFGRAALSWSWIARGLEADRLRELRSWLERRAGRAILASRFFPGSRVPLYVMAGLVGVPASVFARSALAATALWTPAVVLLTATFGEAFAGRVSPAVGSGAPTHLVAAGMIVLLLNGLRSRAGSG